MISLLVKLFYGEMNMSDEKAVRRAYGTACSGAGIGFNVLLFAGKLIAGMLSGSVAIVSDAFNNLSDAGSSIILSYRIRSRTRSIRSVTADLNTYRAFAFRF